MFLIFQIKLSFVVQCFYIPNKIIFNCPMFLIFQIKLSLTVQCFYIPNKTIFYCPMFLIFQIKLSFTVQCSNIPNKTIFYCPMFIIFQIFLIWIHLRSEGVISSNLQKRIIFSHYISKFRALKFLRGKSSYILIMIYHSLNLGTL